MVADADGFFRDELYFVACGERLAWGYVDQTLLIAAVAAARARQLGGGAPAMALASAAVAVAAAWARLPEHDRARAVIFTTNYGRAAAIELLGRRVGMPQPISGHNSDHLWGLPPGLHDVMLAVGGRAEDHARSFHEVVMVGGTPRIPFGIPDESDIPIYLLRRPARRIQRRICESMIRAGSLAMT